MNVRNTESTIIIIIIIIHGLGRLTCSGIDVLPSFPGASAIPSSPGFVGEGVFRESGFDDIGVTLGSTGGRNEHKTLAETRG